MLIKKKKLTVIDRHKNIVKKGDKLHNGGKEVIVYNIFRSPKGIMITLIESGNYLHKMNCSQFRRSQWRK